MARNYPWKDAWDSLRRVINEDQEAIRKLVDDQDSICSARNLRRERLATLDYILANMDELEHWEW